MMQSDVLREIEALGEEREPGLGKLAGSSLLMLVFFGGFWVAANCLPALALLWMHNAVWAPLFERPPLDFLQAYLLMASLYVVGVIAWIPLTLTAQLWRAGRREE